MKDQPCIRIGVLHSLSGTMAADEKHLATATRMAVDEINQNGGVLGRQVEIVLRDGASDPVVFALQARALIEQDRINTIFGCWTSSSRKAVKPIIEKHNALLWYPVQYEGLEQSPNILYTGSCLNQQIEPAVTWALAKEKRRCFLVGSDYVFPRTANSLIRALTVRGGGCVLEEQYVPLGSNDLAEVAERIAQSQPDIVYNTINGDGNLAFFREFRRAVGDVGACPIMSFSLSELSLAQQPRELAGHYACWSYFRQMQTPENDLFLNEYAQRFGPEAMVDDPIATAYTQVYLWKQVAEKACSLDVPDLLDNVAGCRVVGPGGVMEIQDNHHVKKLALIAQATEEGRFDVVWSSKHPIDPKPWLGVEDVELPTQGLVLEALRQFPEVVHLNTELESRVRERTTELQQSNEALREEIVQRERVQEALHKAREELLNQQRREKELVEAELAAAREKLVKSTRLATLGQLTATVSHEIRNPLGTIRTAVYSINQEVGGHSPLVDRALARAERNIIRCDQIIEELLDFTRTKKPNLVATDIDRWLSSLLDEQDMPERISVIRGLNAGVKLPVDREQFRRCVVNLLSNACQAMADTDDARLTIETSVNDGRLLLAVHDTGRGIEKEVMDKIFEPLYTTKGFGVGLGLPVVMQLMRQLGGGVEIQSEPGRGTRATLWLLLPGA